MSSTSIFYRLSFAVVVALGMTALVALSLRFMVVGLFLGAPGWPIAIVIGALSQCDSALIFPLSVFLGYLCVALLFVFWKPSDGLVWRRRTLIIAIPVVILVGLASVPKLDPLISEGMTDLRNKESLLRSQIKNETTVEQAERILKLNGMSSTEEVETSDINILSRGNFTIGASAGDLVLSNHLSPYGDEAETDAYQFPCSYHLQVVLVFDQNRRLKQRYIDEMRLCP